MMLSYHIFMLSLCQLGTWIKNVYDTTLVNYKAKLSLWNKGTGGGSGLKAHFETWSDDKFNKYDIDEDDYDHTDINSRPPILMDLYVKSKKYLTCIFLWDSKLDYLISSKYDPLNLGRGEAGLKRACEDNSMSGISTATNRSITTSPSKNKNEMATMVKSVIDAVMHSSDSSQGKKRKQKQSKKSNRR